MTNEQFIKYCKRNKPTKVIPTEYEIQFYFKKTVRIDACNGIDGFYYIKYTKARGNTKELLASLIDFTPKFYENMKEKYSKKNFKSMTNNFLINSNPTNQ